MRISPATAWGPTFSSLLLPYQLIDHLLTFLDELGVGGEIL